MENVSSAPNNCAISYNLITSTFHRMKLILERDDERFYLWKKDLPDSTSLNVTNFKKLWKATLSKTNILDRFKENNSLVQAKPEWILEHFASCLDAEKPLVTLEVFDNRCVLELKDHLKEIKVKSIFILYLQSDDEFYDAVTFPLTIAVNQLLDQRTKLLDIVRAKDVELSEYKLEGATITRKNVETDEFNANDFLNSSSQEHIKKMHLGKSSPLNFTSDLRDVFCKTTELTLREVLKSEDLSSPLPASPSKENQSPSGSNLKRPLASYEKIVQIPRTKQQKKNFNL